MEQTNQNQQRGKRKKKVSPLAYKIYIAIVAIVFCAMTAVFIFFPRSEYSELEKRDLATFPELDSLTTNPAQFTKDVSSWFSDTEPYRDNFMTLSMNIRDKMRMTFGDDEDAVTFRPSATNDGGADVNIGPSDMDMTNPDLTGSDIETPNDTTAGTRNAEDVAKIASAGIIIVGKGENVRALMAYGGSPSFSNGYIDAVNTYARELPGVNIYAMPIPIATEFYLPEKAASTSRPQRPVLEHIRNGLSGARYVDAHAALAAHVDEPIYLRTDHHWSPLGGYYAARQFAQTAGVPFRDLSSYDQHVIHRFVGSMYGYSKDISVKNAPEDFVYYTPRGLNYSTTYVTYRVNKSYQVTSETKPYSGAYFHKFKDGSGSAYLTFMGGDQHLVKIKTGTPGSRRVLIIKDSYGNTLPGYLFYSFNEVHIVDFRYFNKNMKQYVNDNGITDIVVAFNIFNTGGKAPSNIKRFLTQRGGAVAPKDSDNKQKVDSTKQKTEKPVKQEEKKPVEQPAETTIEETSDNETEEETTTATQQNDTPSPSKPTEE